MESTGSPFLRRRSAAVAVSVDGMRRHAGTRVGMQRDGDDSSKVLVRVTSNLVGNLP